MSNRIPIKQITSWSFSRYSDYKQCPFKCKLKHIDKIQEPPNEAMARGAELHDDAAAYIKGTKRSLNKELKLIKDELAAIKKLMKKKVLTPIVEDNWALTKDWLETVWNDWKHCWLRVKLDAAYYEDDSGEVLLINDWKSGKMRPELHQDYLEQLELYAVSAFKLLPHVKVVKPRLHYFDQGMVYPENQDDLVFTREKDEKRLQKLWEKRVKPMLNDKIFAPTPNAKCCWCFYRKANKANGGGQCKY